MTTPTPITNWFPGGKLGRYVLISPLAAGGMAEIWLARQPGLHGFEKIVVIKRMIGALQHDPEHVEMFLSEARLAAGLSHRYLVQIFELGEEAGSFFIVMEFVEGESLSRIFKTSREARPVPLEMSVQLCAWAAEGLHYAHTRTDAEGQLRGIIHRDVSPQNLLVTVDGSLKLVDFGIAKVANEETLSGKLKGKIAYMPPEQARAEPLDARADVFSLGVVLFELLTGTRLFGKLPELEVLKRLISEQPLPRCRERNPEVPEALDAVVARAMAPKRSERFATARDFQGALEDWLSGNRKRVTSADIADWLNALFPERHAERRAMLEAARKGEALSPQLASKLFATSGSGNSGGAGSGSASQARIAAASAAAAAAQPSEDVSVSFAQPASARSRAGMVLVGLLLGLALVAAALLLRPVEPVADSTVDAGAPALGSLSIEATPRASVQLDGKGAGSTPLLLEPLAPGDHQLVLEAPGYLPQQRSVKVAAGAKVQLVVTLEKEPAVDAGATAEATPPAVPVKPLLGKLNLRTTPYTTVYLGKRKLGDTPLVGFPLPAGSHQLRLVNLEAKLESSIEVTIAANKTTNESLVLK